MLERHIRTLLAAAAVVALLAGTTACGSDSDATGSACTTAQECARGETCTVEGVCGTQACESAGDCQGVGVVCLRDLNLCSARECETGAAPGTDMACEAGYICTGGTCILEQQPTDDVVGGDTTPIDIKDPPVDVAADVPTTPVNVAACTVCTDDAACGQGKTCEQLGAAKACFATCTDDGDCAAGWLCAALTNEGKWCVPSAYTCEATCLLDGCPAGQVCDQTAGSATEGTCIAGKAECATCIYDWQCTTGYRCSKNGTCMLDCAATVCPAWGTCEEKGDVGGTGVMVCEHANPTCCGASCSNDCDPACSGSRPVCYNGYCVQCLADTDCRGSGETCDAVAHMCTGGLCSTNATQPYEYQGQCVQCLEDAHCGAGNTCDLTSHACSGGDPCGGMCAAPYPGCAVINGVPSCVPCTEDAHCTSGTCDPTTYSCQCPGGVCAVACNQDCVAAGCPMSTAGFDLACDPDTGCCYDKGGMCDNVEAYCNEDTGSRCVSIFDMFMGGQMPGGTIPGMPGGGGGVGEFAGGMCSCNAVMSTVCNLFPSTPGCESAGSCYEGANCMPIGTLMQLMGSLGGGGGGAALIEGDFCTSFSLGGN